MTPKATVTYLESNEMQKARAFSPAVITEGGRTVWLAGQTTTTDLDGHDISGQFEAQCRTCFALIIWVKWGFWLLFSSGASVKSQYPQPLHGGLNRAYESYFLDILKTCKYKMIYYAPGSRQFSNCCFIWFLGVFFC
jgi:hypothetical protein